METDRRLELVPCLSTSSTYRACDWCNQREHRRLLMIIIVAEREKFGLLITERTSSSGNDADGGRAKLGSSSTHSDASVKHNKQTRARETGISFFSFLSEKAKRCISVENTHTHARTHTRRTHIDRKIANKRSYARVSLLLSFVFTHKHTKTACRVVFSIH